MEECHVRPPPVYPKPIGQRRQFEEQGTNAQHSKVVLERDGRTHRSLTIDEAEINRERNTGKDQGGVKGEET